MSGWFALLSSTDAPKGVEGALAESLTFRGPDGTQMWRGGVALLCESLLKVERRGADTTLPAHFGDLVIVGDIRLDSRDELIGELKPHVADVTSTTGDAQLILRAYEQWGADCLEHLAGDFAFAIWHTVSRSFFCARDRLGLKPFYYAQTRGGILLSNTLACIRRHPQVSSEIDELAVGDFLAFGDNWLKDRTFFRDIRRLPPAHSMQVTDSGINSRRYWELQPQEPLRYAREEVAVERFRSVLREAVRDRIPSDRAGVLMSGGLDSTLLAAMARDVMLHDTGHSSVHAVSGYFSHLIPDQEKYYASIAATHLGIETEFIEVDRELELYQEWDSASLPLPEPVDNPLEVVRHRLYRALAAKVRVGLTGYDGDALLFLHHAPHFRRLLSKGQFGRLFGDAIRYARDMRRLPPIGLRTAWQRIAHFDRFPPWIGEDFAVRIGLKERWRERLATPPAPDSDRADTYAAMTAPMWVPLFESHDAGVTGLPLDFYHPFTDLRVVMLTMRLPPIPWCINKKLIRDAASSIIPPALISRPKTTLSGDPVRAAVLRGMVSRPESALQAAREFIDVGKLQSPLDVDQRLWEARTVFRPLSLGMWLTRLSRGQASHTIA